MLVWLGHNQCQHLGPKTPPLVPHSPQTSSSRRFSIQLQGLLQGLGYHLLPPAQEGLLLSTGLAAQPHSQFPGSGGKEGTMKQLLGSSGERSWACPEKLTTILLTSFSPTSPHLWCPD